MPHLFCFGLGYTATALSLKLQAQGWQVSGTCQSLDKQKILRDMGFDVDIFDGQTASENIVAKLNTATHILQSIAPNKDGDPVLAVLAEKLRARARGIEWFGYSSTTAVYGDRQGGWVDETDDLAPSMQRGFWREAAESQWRAEFQEADLPVHIFRLAGIYGPGRNQLIKLQQKKARRVIREGQLFSRIHVDDIAQVLEASIKRPNPGEAYNVCDNEAAPPQDVIEFAANLLGIAPPPEELFEEADLTPMARSFYSESKKVSNEKIKSELGVKLKYPTYREGIRSLVASL